MTRPVRSALFALALALCAAVLAAPAEAALHCRNKVVSRGDPAAKLLEFCGKPQAVQKRLVQRAYVSPRGLALPGFVEEVWIEEWTYNFGPYRLMRVVRIEDGVVDTIRHLGRGY